MAAWAVPPGAVFVFGLIAVALLLFVTEPIPTDMTAVGVIVVLVVMEPLTDISAAEALSGFSSPATITIVAMFMLSAGVQRTGIVHRLGAYMADVTRGRELHVLAATVGTTGPIAGIINNTPVVAVFIPVVTDLADSSRISPSKLLLPLSFAAMLGGTLTLIGTSTNILASDLSRQLLGRPIRMFEFTKLGVIILVVGIAYLLTVGRRLIPDRMPPATDLTAEFDLEDHLAQVVVRDGSPIVGRRIEDLFGADPEIAVLQIGRGDEAYHGPDTDRVVEPGDVLTVRASLQAVNRFATENGLRHLQREEVTEETLRAAVEGVPIEVVVPAGSGFAGRSIADAKFEDRYGTTILAIRRGDETIRTGFGDQTLEAGDTVLIQTTLEAVDFFSETGDLVVTHAPSYPDDVADAEPGLDPKTPIALGILALVIGVAAMGAVPIVIAALGGVVAMITTGVLSASEAYDAVSWNVVFLLAGVIPLGLAMQQTGGAAIIADLLVGSAAYLPLIAVLALFYVVTGLLSNVITPVASLVLMVPIAVDTAGRIGGNEFAFLLAVMFASSTAFMTPVGYQTNLMVYGPGGYVFTDYLRVGAPLQLLLAFVTTLGIAFFWGVTP